MEKSKRNEWIPSEDTTRAALFFLIVISLVAIGDAVIDFGIFIIKLIKANPEISERVFEVAFCGAVAISIFIVCKGHKHLLG